MCNLFGDVGMFEVFAKLKVFGVFLEAPHHLEAGTLFCRVSDRFPERLAARRPLKPQIVFSPSKNGLSGLK